MIWYMCTVFMRGSYLFPRLKSVASIDIFFFATIKCFKNDVFII